MRESLGQVSMQNQNLLPHPPQCAHWGTFPRWGKDKESSVS